MGSGWTGQQSDRDYLKSDNDKINAGQAEQLVQEALRTVGHQAAEKKAEVMGAVEPDPTNRRAVGHAGSEYEPDGPLEIPEILGFGEPNPYFCFRDATISRTRTSNSLYLVRNSLKSCFDS